MLISKLEISKKLLLRLAVFIAMVSTAIIFDVYFENNPAELESIEAGSQEKTNEPGGIYLISQTNSISLKTAAQKSLTRTSQLGKHDKFLRKYFQLRNYQVLKAEVKDQTTPLILSYHYLVFQTHFFPRPDEDPLA